MSDKYGTERDPYCYPGTHILINKLDIHDAETLDQAERELSYLAAMHIELQPPPYDLNYWRQLHLQLFGDIYDWAGHIRCIDLAKGQTRFCSVRFIEHEAMKLFAKFNLREQLDKLPFERLVDIIATLYVELNVVHPFREGNGRAQRVLFEHVLYHLGWVTDWSQVDRDIWLHANIHGYHGNYQPMIDIFKRCIVGPISE